MTDKNIKRLTLNEIREKKKKLLQEAKSKATNTNKAKEKKNPSPLKKPGVTKKRKSRFKTGSYESVKCTNGPMSYRSGWELIVGQYLDIDPDVKSWEYEPFKIQWVSNTKTGRIRLYIPDFFIIYCNGTRKLIEVKGDRFVNRPTVQKKARMGISWAKNNQAEYEMWTGKKITALKKIVEASQTI
jgi:hypothetical protein